MKKATQCVTLGRHPQKYQGAVNPPVVHASTMVFPTLDDCEAAEKGTYHLPSYGGLGTGPVQDLEAALAQLCGADAGVLTASGTAAVTTALLSVARTGDHLLVTDSVYGPTRRICDTLLKGLGVETTYYDPQMGGHIKALLRPNTRAVYIESPGSFTFEMQDIPAIAEAARAGGATVIADTTWATPLFFDAFAHGVDITVQSVTKYIGGHSDLVMGFVAARKPYGDTVLRTFRNLAAYPAPDNCYLAQRGLRTLPVRLKQHERSALALASWLKARPEVLQVLHPALPECPGHEFWKRDMKGSTGLFSVLLKPYKREALARMLDHMELFKMGWSWGGYESLILPFSVRDIRTATKWKHDGVALRLHAGLEDPEDLIRDLYAGFERLNKAA